ncbi:MAG: ATP synthase F1 subunit epsilon [Eubacteriales bacterium]|nr:ATP synthase F1 subunit epsilon [Eubacteriales bacterium]
MALTFRLSVITPEREFFSGDAESLTVETIDGQICVLANHEPLVTALNVGVLKIVKRGGEVLRATHTEGFMQVNRDSVTLLAQACEWPHEIDLPRAEEAYARAQARAREAKNVDDVIRLKVAMLRASTRIKVKRYGKH